MLAIDSLELWLLLVAVAISCFLCLRCRFLRHRGDSGPKRTAESILALPLHYAYCLSQNGKLLFQAAILQVFTCHMLNVSIRLHPYSKKNQEQSDKMAEDWYRRAEMAVGTAQFRRIQLYYFEDVCGTYSSLIQNLTFQLLGNT